MLNYVFNFDSFAYCIFGHRRSGSKPALLSPAQEPAVGTLPRRGRRWWGMEMVPMEGKAGRLNRPFSTECPSHRLPEAAHLGGCLSSPTMRKDPEHTGAGKVLASVLVQITQPGKDCSAWPRPRAPPPQGAPSVPPGGEHQPAEEGDPRVRKTSLF